MFVKETPTVHTFWTTIGLRSIYDVINHGPNQDWSVLRHQFTRSSAHFRVTSASKNVLNPRAVFNVLCLLVCWRYVPTMDDVEKYKSHKGPVTELHIVDQYMMEVLLFILNITLYSQIEMTSPVTGAEWNTAPFFWRACWVFIDLPSHRHVVGVMMSSLHSSGYHLPARLAAIWLMWARLKAAGGVTDELEDQPTVAFRNISHLM